jgi:murein L,D-transpeptidase YafK
MKQLKWALGLVALLVLSSCSSNPFLKQYSGPKVTQILVEKDSRQMYLLHNKRVLKAYDISLGFAPTGDKLKEGDGRTPEGLYFIDRRNPQSRFHLSLGINYPNARDRAEARAEGVDPGGDIFIHGRPKRFRNGVEDWTAGCIAVTDEELEELYAMVEVGTPIFIKP